MTSIFEAHQAGVPDTAMLERTALLFNGMAQGVVFQARSGAIVLANPAAEQILGLTMDQMLGRTSAENTPFLDDEHPSIVALHTGETVRDVIMGVYNPAANEQRWIRVTAVPQFRDGEKEPFEVFTTFEDITELKRMEQALRRSEERFRVAAECSNDTLYEWHLDTDEVEYFGRNRSGLPDGGRAPAREWIERLHPDERENIAVELQHRLADGRPYAARHRIASPDGHWLHVETRGQALYDESGRPVRWIGASNDVSDHMEASESLKQALTLFEAVVEGTNDPVFVRNRNGQYLMVNSAGARRLNRSAAEIIGRTNFDLLPRAMADEMHKTDQDVLRKGQSVTYESVGPGAGRYFTTKVPYRNAAGEIIGVLGIARDITELKRLEAEYRQAQKMEAVGRLAGGVAHDFNNLLTILLGYIDELQHSASGNDAIALAEMKGAAKRASQLTSQLLAFSRRQILQPEAVDVNALVVGFERFLLRVVGEDIQLSTDLAPDAGTIHVDRGQFEQVLMNLVVNSRDAMSSGGRLTIATRRCELAHGQAKVPPGPYVMLTVTDTGAGIPADVVPKIFEPFYTTKGRAGTGLGLSTVYGIVKQSGGDVWAESEMGRGTTFSIILPRIAERREEARASREVELVKAEGVILLVEDEEPLRGLLRTVLERQGYTVHCCSDVPEAREWLRRWTSRLDLILTDMVMPNGTGLQIEAAARETHPSVALLFMSGYAENAGSNLNELPMGTHFIQKPFTPRALAAKLHNILTPAP